MFYKKTKILIVILFIISIIVPYFTESILKINGNTEAKCKQTISEKIIEKTETKTIYDLGNGKRKAELFSEKIRFKDEKGNYVDYNNILTNVGKKSVLQEENLFGYMYQTKQSDKIAYFPEKLSKSTPILIENSVYQAWISPINLNCDSLKEIYDEGSKKVKSVKYENVAKSVDLQYKSINEGLKENIILKNREAPNTYSFKLKVKDCGIISQEALMKSKVSRQNEINTKSGEALYIFDFKANKLVGSIPAAYMIDAKNDYSEKCKYTVILKKNMSAKGKVSYEYELSVIADMNYLQSEKRSYPVTIDPTIIWDETSPQRLASAYVCANFPNANYSNSSTNILCIGKRESASDTCRTYIRFFDLKTLLNK